MARVPGPQNPVIAGIGPSVFNNNQRAIQGPTVQSGLSTIGRATAQVGDIIHKDAVREEALEQERLYKEADNVYQKSRNLILHGDGTSQNVGFYNLNGELAIEARVDVEASLLDAQAEAAAMIPTKQSQGNFVAATAVDITLHTNKINQHTAKARKEAQAQTADARYRQSIENAALNSKDKAIVDGNISVGRDEAFQAAIAKGFTVEAATQIADEARSIIAEAAVQAAIDNGDTSVAQALLDAYSVEGKDGSTVINGQAQGALAKKLAQVELLAEAQAETDRIAAMGLTGSKQLVEARKITDPKLRAAVEQQITVRNEQTRAARREADQSNIDDITAHVNAGRPTKDIQIDQWNALTLGQQKAFLERERIVASDAPVQTNAFIYKTVMSYTDEQFRDANPVEIENNLAPKDFERWKAAQVQAMKRLNNPSNDGENNAFTSTQMFNKRMKGLTRQLAKNTKRRFEQEMQMFNLFQDEIDLHKNAHNGKLPNTSEMRVILDTITDRIVIDEFWFGLDKRGFVFQIEIPDDELAEVTSRFTQREGRAPTDLELKLEYSDIVESR